MNNTIKNKFTRTFACHLHNLLAIWLQRPRDRYYVPFTCFICIVITRLFIDYNLAVVLLHYTNRNKAGDEKIITRKLSLYNIPHLIHPIRKNHCIWNYVFNPNVSYLHEYRFIYFNSIYFIIFDNIFLLFIIKAE